MSTVLAMPWERKITNQSQDQFPGGTCRRETVTREKDEPSAMEANVGISDIPIKEADIMECSREEVALEMSLER